MLRLTPHKSKFLKLAISLLLTGNLFGCAMNHTTDGLGNQFIAFNDVKVITQKEAKSLERDDRSVRIKSDMESIGFRRVKVSTIIDSLSDTVLSIYKNQYELLQRYSTIVDNHRDVMSFINANKDKNKTELRKEAERFDQLAVKQEEKIGPKLAAYQTANKEIQRENLKLAGELLKQTATLVTVFRNSTDEMKGAEALAILLNAGKINDAYKLAEIRIHLATVANDFIDDEKAVIEITKQIQEILDEKL